MKSNILTLSAIILLVVHASLFLIINIGIHINEGYITLREANPTIRILEIIFSALALALAIERLAHLWRKV